MITGRSRLELALRSTRLSAASTFEFRQPGSSEPPIFAPARRCRCNSSAGRHERKENKQKHNKTKNHSRKTRVACSTTASTRSIGHHPCLQVAFDRKTHHDHDVVRVECAHSLCAWPEQWQRAIDLNRKKISSHFAHINSPCKTHTNTI